MMTPAEQQELEELRQFKRDKLTGQLAQDLARGGKRRPNPGKAFGAP